MFALAQRDNIRLNPLEIWLREQVELAHRLDRSRDAAILSIPAIGPHVDQAMRRSILTHELAHGQFFTLPFFAAHVMRVWETGFTEAERTAVRRFLQAEGYDGELSRAQWMALRFFAQHLQSTQYPPDAPSGPVGVVVGVTVVNLVVLLMFAVVVVLAFG